MTTESKAADHIIPKFLQIQDILAVNNALNFDTADCNVVGGCELYTTKAAGDDKKLYKSIEKSLESQHESLVQLSKSISPPKASAFALNLSRPSPFGPFSLISSRRAFAYMIATLNASYPDYDFSNTLRPEDFRRERSLKAVCAIFNNMLYNLRPKSTGQASTGAYRNTDPDSFVVNDDNPIWGPKKWKAIDKEMDLRTCAIYCWEPEQDPFDGEDGAIWRINYFFFNKEKKRVCYVHLRGVSIASHSPVETNMPLSPLPDRKRGSASGIGRYANYWPEDDTTYDSARDEDDGDSTFDWNEDRDLAGVHDEHAIMEFIEERRSKIRGVSEDIADAMEV
ncbi:MAG: RNA polymerase III-inhibiting protein maf1 [Vezdaea aestivalis]|nr:MAG: RNA polymerase III-inhibiting protein maf1 [Vezdaea aestivalis]